MAFACVTASRPWRSTPAGRTPGAKKLDHRLSAMPHSAIAHDGSAASAALNPVMARENSNECSSETARLNSGWAWAVQDV